MLEGKFGNCQVDEVLQTIVQGKGTGRLNLEGTSIFGGRVQATFYIEDSRMVHVDVGPGTAYSSLVDLFSLREGEFLFCEWRDSEDQRPVHADCGHRPSGDGGSRRVEFDAPEAWFT